MEYYFMDQGITSYGFKSNYSIFDEDLQIIFPRFGDLMRFVVDGNSTYQDLTAGYTLPSKYYI